LKHWVRPGERSVVGPSLTEKICPLPISISGCLIVVCNLDIRMHNKPDLMIRDLRTKGITLIEVGITNKNILATTELTKSRKYELLANELKCIHPGTKVTIIPVVM